VYDPAEIVAYRPSVDPVHAAWRLDTSPGRETWSVATAAVAGPVGEAVDAVAFWNVKGAEGVDGACTLVGFNSARAPVPSGGKGTWVLDLMTSGCTNVNLQVPWSRFAISDDGETAVAWTQGDSGSVTIYAVNAQTGVLRWKVDVPARGGDYFTSYGVDISADGRWVVYDEGVVGSGQNYHVLSSVDGKPRAAPVLGQTATTDAVTGGLGSGKEHRAVQKDIQTADGKALAAILNRDLVRPWVMLNHGPRKTYPRIRIEEVEQEDLKALADALGPMIDRGMEVDQATMLERFGLPEPKAGAKLLRPASSGAAPTVPMDPSSKIKQVSGEIKRGEAAAGTPTALQAEGPLAGLKSGSAEMDPAAELADRLAIEAVAPMDALFQQILPMLEAAGSLEEFRAMVLAAYPKLDAAPLARVIGDAQMVAHASGRAAVLTESGDR
jgi:hypothetical protein